MPSASSSLSRASEPLGVLALPLCDVLAVDLFLEAAVGFLLGEELIELRMQGGLEVGAVLLTLEPGVRIRRDDDVRVVGRVDGGHGWCFRDQRIDNDAGS